MPGEFVRIGETTFPQIEPPIPCNLYEWRSTTPERHGKFSIRFISPTEGSLAGRYWVQPLLELWVQERLATTFLEEACAYGYEIVAEMNHHTPEQRAAYRLAAWLFRNRHAGHMAVTREFKSAADFVDFSNATVPTLITPGIGVHQSEVEWEGSDARDMAKRLLKEAFEAVQEQLAEHGEDLPPLKANFEGVLEVYQRFVTYPDRSAGRPLSAFAYRGIRVAVHFPVPY